jgi:hypothetical protein
VPTESVLQTAGSHLIPAAVAVIDPTAIGEPEEASAEEPEESEDEPEPETDDDIGEETEDEAVRSDPLDDPRYDYWMRAEQELTRRDGMWYGVARERFEDDAAFVKSAFRRQGRDAQALERILRQIVAAYAVDGMLYEGWVAAFRDVMARGLIAGAQRIAGVGASWTIQSPEVLAAIESGTRLLARYVGETTAQQITAAMRASEVAGLSVAETARLIQATVYGERMTDTRSKLIARTENAKATNLGAWGQAQEMGIYQSKEWIAFGDAKTREAHSYAMGLGIVPMDYGFPGESGALLQYPGDPSGAASDVANCRCVLGFYDTPAPMVTA